MTDIMIANSIKNSPGPCRLVRHYGDGRYYILPLSRITPDGAEAIGIYDSPEDAADGACRDEATMLSIGAQS